MAGRPVARQEQPCLGVLCGAFELLGTLPYSVNIHLHKHTLLQIVVGDFTSISIFALRIVFKSTCIKKCMHMKEMHAYFAYIVYCNN